MRESGTFLGHTGCDLCGSSDAVAVYEQEDGKKNGFCWSCTSFIKTESVEGKAIDSSDTNKKTKKREPITERQINYINKITGFKANGYRGIADSVLAYTGIRTELDEDGKVVCRYYPTHIDGILVGYKRRFDPKDFSRGSIGMFGVSCDLLGMDKHRKGVGRRVLIAGGEEDYAAAVQMLRQYQVSKKITDSEPFAVVSPLTGETGCLRQIRNNMDYLDAFDMIIIGFDNDEKGREAAEELAMILPEGKAYIAELPAKDINKCLEDGLQKHFIESYFKAKPFSPSSIKDSADFDFLEDAIERALIPRIPLPPFLEGVSDLLCGGIPLGYMVNIASGSGSGKSTIVNECVYFWAMNSPHKVGVISLEATAGEYYTNILSRHLKCKIELIRDVDEKVAFLRSDYVRDASEQLRVNEEGEGRFTLLDDRGDINSIKTNIERMIKVNKCKVIVVDPLQDILDEISTEDEAKFLRWQKGLLQKHNVSIININHTRKNSSDKKANSRGADLNEEDMSGSSTIFKSGGINIIITRDKLAEDPITRNTINVVVTKARGTGLTGTAGQLYYLSKSHTMVKMTSELKQQLEETHGMVSVEDAKKATDVFQEIPSGFEEQDIFGDGDVVDTPFELDED